MPNVRTGRRAAASNLSARTHTPQCRPCRSAAYFAPARSCCRSSLRQDSRCPSSPIYTQLGHLDFYAPNFPGTTPKREAARADRTRASSLATPPKSASKHPNFQVVQVFPIERNLGNLKVGIPHVQHPPVPEGPNLSLQPPVKTPRRQVSCIWEKLGALTFNAPISRATTGNCKTPAIPETWRLDSPLQLSPLETRPHRPGCGSWERVGEVLNTRGHEPTARTEIRVQWPPHIGPDTPL